jgi:Holliday junction resolvase
VRERDFQATIVQAARYAGWNVYWVWSSIHSPKGWVDLFLLKDGKALAYEVKTAQGRIRPEQIECLALLQAAGIPARIVRPADFDEVLAELQEAG